MDVGGGYILTDAQESAWATTYSDEYAEYIAAGLYDPDTNVLCGITESMHDGAPTNGPLDFALTPSHGTHGQ